MCSLLIRLPLGSSSWNTALLVIMHSIVQNRDFPNSTWQPIFWCRLEFCTSRFCCTFTNMTPKLIERRSSWCWLRSVRGDDLFNFAKTKLSTWKFRFLEKTTFNSCEFCLHFETCWSHVVWQVFSSVIEVRSWRISQDLPFGYVEWNRNVKRHQQQTSPTEILQD